MELLVDVLGADFEAVGDVVDLVEVLVLLLAQLLVGLSHEVSERGYYYRI